MSLTTYKGFLGLEVGRGLDGKGAEGGGGRLMSYYRYNECSICIHVYIYIYTYIHTYTHIHIYIYIHI